METMNYREKRKKSLKGPIFAIASFLTLGTGVITYAIINEKEPITVGSRGALLTGEVPTVVEQNALETLSKESLLEMFEVKKYYTSDTSNEHIKSDISLPYVYINGEELSSFNKEINEKFTNSYNAFKESMSDAKHSFTYNVNYENYDNIVENEGILSVIITEKMIDGESSNESMCKKHTYNINLTTGSVIKQSDVIVDLLGSGYKDAVKQSITTYLEENSILSKEEYKYAYTGLENFYISNGILHFIFNAGELVDKSYGTLDIEIKKIENKINQDVDIYTE